MDELSTVVYVRGRCVYERCPLSKSYLVYWMYVTSGQFQGYEEVEGASASALYSQLGVFFSLMIKDHEIHVVDSEGDQLLDIFLITG